MLLHPQDFFKQISLWTHNIIFSKYLLKVQPLFSKNQSKGSHSSDALSETKVYFPTSQEAYRCAFTHQHPLYNAVKRQWWWKDDNETGILHPVLICLFSGNTKLFSGLKQYLTEYYITLMLTPFLPFQRRLRGHPITVCKRKYQDDHGADKSRKRTDSQKFKLDRFKIKKFKIQFRFKIRHNFFPPRESV